MYHVCAAILTKPNMKMRGQRIWCDFGCRRYCSLAFAAPLSSPVMVGISEKMRPMNTTMAQISLRIVGRLRSKMNLKPLYYYALC